MLPAMDSPAQTLTATRQPVLVSRTRAAELLGLTERSIDRYITRGHLAARKDPGSGRVGVDVASIQAFAARRVVISA
jgi:predicted DNA-binding transcriptional regulator AlpA